MDVAPLTPDESAALAAGNAPPEVATRALAIKSAEYRARNAPPPPTPGTPEAAASRLAELQGDPTFRSKLMKGAPRETEQFHALSEAISKGDPVDVALAMDGDPSHVLSNTWDGGRPSAHAVAAEIPALREVGLSDAVIEELLRDEHTATPQEVALVQRYRSACHSNPEWVAKYLSGDSEARRLATLMAIVAVQAGAVTP